MEISTPRTQRNVSLIKRLDYKIRTNEKAYNRNSRIIPTPSQLFFLLLDCEISKNDALSACKTFFAISRDKRIAVLETNELLMPCSDEMPSHS